MLFICIFHVINDVQPSIADDLCLSYATLFVLQSMSLLNIFRSVDALWCIALVLGGELMTTFEIFFRVFIIPGNFLVSMMPFSYIFEKNDFKTQP